MERSNFCTEWNNFWMEPHEYIIYLSENTAHSIVIKKLATIQAIEWKKQITIWKYLRWSALKINTILA